MSVTDAQEESVDAAAASEELNGEAAPCANCGEEILVDSNECPTCGNNPRKKAKWTSVIVMATGVLTMPFLIGIPIFLVGLAARVGMYWTTYSPTEYGWG